MDIGGGGGGGRWAGRSVSDSSLLASTSDADISWQISLLNAADKDENSKVRKILNDV